MRFLCSFFVLALIAYIGYLFYLKHKEARKDVLTMQRGDNVVTITSDGDGMFNVKVTELTMFGFSEQIVLEMNVSKDALFDVVNSLKSKDYIDEAGENLIMAKFSL